MAVCTVLCCVAVRAHLEGFPTQEEVKAQLQLLVQAMEEKENKSRKGGRKKKGIHEKEHSFDDDKDNGAYRPTGAVARPNIGKGSAYSAAPQSYPLHSMRHPSDMFGLYARCVVCGVRMTSRNKQVISILQDQVAGKHAQPLKQQPRFAPLSMTLSPTISYGRPGEQSVNGLFRSETAEERFARETSMKREKAQRDRDVDRHFRDESKRATETDRRDEHTDADVENESDFEPTTSFRRDNHPNPTVRSSKQASSFLSASKLSPSSTSNTFHNQNRVSSYFTNPTSLPSSSFYKPIRKSDESGMRNLGNSCYMNAILQALLAQPTFTNALSHTQSPAPLSPSSLLTALSSLAQQHSRVNRDVIDPGLVKDVIGKRQSRFAGNRQQDAHEFLMELLNGVTDDLVEAQVAQWRKKQTGGEERKEGHEVEQQDNQEREADMGMEIELEHDTDRTRTPPSIISPTSFIADTPRSAASSAQGDSLIDALVAATQNGERRGFHQLATTPSSTQLSSVVHRTDADHLLDGMHERQEEEEEKLAPATPPSAQLSTALQALKEQDEDGHLVIDISDTIDGDEEWVNRDSSALSAGFSPPVSPSANTTSPIPSRSAGPPPPSHLLKLWQEQASELSPAHLTFHLEVEVTLECANDECKYRRTNMEHFNVLSLDLPEEVERQKKLDQYMFNGSKESGINKENDRGSNGAISSGSINDNSFTHFPPPTSSSFSSSATSTAMPTSPMLSTTAVADKTSNVAPYLKLPADNKLPVFSNARSYTRVQPASNITSSSISTTSSSSSSSASNSMYEFGSSPSPSPSASSSSTAVPAASRPYGPRLNVRSLVQNFFAPSTIECRCEKCQYTHVRVTSHIAQLPRVLCLHIKRFTPNWRLGTYEKRKDVVEVQQELDIAFACKLDVQRPDTQQQQQPNNILVCPTPVKQNASTPPADRFSPLNPTPNHPPSSPLLFATPVTPRASTASTVTPSSSALSPSSSHALNSSDAISPASSKRGRYDSADSGTFEFGDTSANKRSRPSPTFSTPVRSKLEERLACLTTEFLHRKADLTKQIDHACRSGDEDMQYDITLKISQLDSDYDEKGAQLQAEVRKEREERERQMREEEDERRRRLEEKERKRVDGWRAADAPVLDEDEEDEEAQFERVLAESKREADEQQQKRETDEKRREEDEVQRAMQLSVIDVGGRLDDDEDGHDADVTPQLEQPLPTFIATPPALPKPPLSPSAPSSASPARYTLKGVVLHKGVSSSSGHYVADLLDDSHGQTMWKRYDDQYVDKMTDRDRMLKTWQNEAYILFFTLT